MSDPVDEAVRKLARRIAFDTAPQVLSCKDYVDTLERILTEQLAPLLRAGQEMRDAEGEIEVADADISWDAAFAKLTGRTP